MMAERTSGILLHPTSLPGPFGIGELGSDAHHFIEVLTEMRQSWWQMLPIGPTGYGDSPYQSPSTFAGNPLLVSWELMAADGLIGADWLRPQAALSPSEVDFAKIFPLRMRALEEASGAFEDRCTPQIAARFAKFVSEHGPVWLDDFAVYTALKRAHDLRPWWDWPSDLAHRQPEALEHARAELASQIRRVEIEQFLFDLHFFRLRQEAGRHGISLIGDLPIFVAHDSSDVWAHPDLFQLDAHGQPTVVAGVPPDYFSETGQRWGNPLYHWDRHHQEGFAWWQARMERALSLFDVIRIDHFRGFVASWEIPADEPTAVRGTWVEAPGIELFDHLHQVFGRLPVIAENLGIITDDVEELRLRYDFPGMKVLQFGFDSSSTHSPEHFTKDVVAYTGTHDNDTTVGWWNTDSRERALEREVAKQLLGTDGEEIHWDFIDATMRSEAAITIFPLQDLMGLGSEARMNTPGTESGNWRWRFRWDDLTTEITERMRRLTEETHRAGGRQGEVTAP